MKKKKRKFQIPREDEVPVESSPRRNWPEIAFYAAIGVFAVGCVLLVVFTRGSAPPEPSAPAPPAPSAASSAASLRDFKVVNGHEHLFSRKHLGKYLAAAERTGIVNTLFVASSDYTLKGKGTPDHPNKPDMGNDENTEEILEAAREHPGKIIPFCTIYPGDPEKLDKLKKFVSEGVKGVKLYSGHPNFYEKNRPLDCEEMLPVYAYCEETGLPICWHVSFTKYEKEFLHVMEMYPKLKVIIPHFGVTFFRPLDKGMDEFGAFLEKYPNAYTDTSFGTREILVAGMEVVDKHPDIFRAYCKKYSDRILFGTDMVVTGHPEKTEEWVESILRGCRELLEKDVYRFPLGAKGSKYASSSSTNVNGDFRGMNLDDDTLRKIYETNIEKLIPTDAR